MASILDAADVTYDTSKAVKSGSKHWFSHKVTGYSGGDASDDWWQGPARVDFTATPSTSKTEIEWEDGQKQTTNVSISWEASIKTAQKDAATIAGFFRAVDGLTMQYLMETIPSGAFRQYVTFMGLMTDPPPIGSKATEYEYKIALGAATATISINLATAYVQGTAAATVFPNFGATTGTVSQPSGEYYGIVDL